MGIFDAETTESMLAKADEWGGPNSFPHFSSAWAVATDAPFIWTKQMAADFGGTRNGMVMHWPKGIKAKGEIRSQWHHVNDVAATVLEAMKLPQPKMVNGVEQKPLTGVSMLYAANDPNAKDRHTTQYFEMFGNRAIYHDGWLARVVHRVPSTVTATQDAVGASEEVNMQKKVSAEKGVRNLFLDWRSISFGLPSESRRFFPAQWGVHIGPHSPLLHPPAIERTQLVPNLHL